MRTIRIVVSLGMLMCAGINLKHQAQNLSALSYGKHLQLTNSRLMPANDAPEMRSAWGELDGIERLHRLDVEATLSDKADELAKLWDNEAVRIQPGRAAEIGKAVIYANDKRWETSSGRAKTLCYKSEIKNIQLAGDWAFEWGYFSIGCRVGANTADDDFVVWCDTQRPHNFGDWLIRVDRDRAARVLHPRAPRHESRSARGAAI